MSCFKKVAKMRIHLITILIHLLIVNKTNQQDCEYSLTVVNERRACRRHVIFDEEFSSGISSKWQIEQFIPTYESNGGDLLFNYFEESNVDVVKNALQITPKMLNEEFIRRGHLKFENCTGTTVDECERSAQFHRIQPPISSGRLNTKNSFSFKYGHVEIVAKVPVGDWLVPELWLLPKNEKYGKVLQSGRMEMMMVRGNTALTHNGTDLGYDVLEAHLLMSAGEKIGSRTLRVKSGEPWHYHFHKYLFSWRPDEITVSVNDIVIGKLVEKNFPGSLASLAGFNHDEAKAWYQGSAMAPFDEEFYISLGLSVGGRDFPDGSMSRYYAKPWRRRSVKEMTDFYSAKDKWAPTFHDEMSKLKILRVKVTAL